MRWYKRNSLQLLNSVGATSRSRYKHIFVSNVFMSQPVTQEIKGMNVYCVPRIAPTECQKCVKYANFCCVVSITIMNHPQLRDTFVFSFADS